MRSGSSSSRMVLRVREINNVGIISGCDVFGRNRMVLILFITLLTKSSFLL